MRDSTKRLLRRCAADAITLAGLERFTGSSRLPWRMLCYHRVIPADQERFPLQPGMTVRPETFEMHMKCLRKYWNPISLSELIEYLSSQQLAVKDLAVHKPLPPKAVVVTFDDGWHDNYVHAFPVLKRYNIPATVFLATSFIGSAKLFWSDELSQSAHALRSAHRKHQGIAPRLREILPEDPLELHPPLAPAVLPLFQSARALLFSYIKCRSTEPRDSSEQNVGVNELSPSIPVPPAATPVQDCQSIDTLVETFKALPYDLRIGTITKLSQLAREFSDISSERVFMNWDEVHEMAEAGVAFGSHTHKHRLLTELSPAEIQDELANAWQILLANNITPSEVFCYPGGQWSREAQTILAERGTRFALGMESIPTDKNPTVLRRINMHEDISYTPSLLNCRVWAEELF